MGRGSIRIPTWSRSYRSQERSSAWQRCRSSTWQIVFWTGWRKCCKCVAPSAATAARCVRILQDPPWRRMKSNELSDFLDKAQAYLMQQRDLFGNIVYTEESGRKVAGGGGKQPDIPPDIPDEPWAGAGT